MKARTEKKAIDVGRRRAASARRRCRRAGRRARGRLEAEPLDARQHPAAVARFGRGAPRAARSAARSGSRRKISTPFEPPPPSGEAAPARTISPPIRNQRARGVAPCRRARSRPTRRRARPGCAGTACLGEQPRRAGEQQRHRQRHRQHPILRDARGADRDHLAAPAQARQKPSSPRPGPRSASPAAASAAAAARHNEPCRRGPCRAAANSSPRSNDVDHLEQQHDRRRRRQGPFGEPPGEIGGQRPAAHAAQRAPPGRRSRARASPSGFERRGDRAVARQMPARDRRSAAPARPRAAAMPQIAASGAAAPGQRRAAGRS